MDEELKKTIVPSSVLKSQVIDFSQNYLSFSKLVFLMLIGSKLKYLEPKNLKEWQK